MNTVTVCATFFGEVFDSLLEEFTCLETEGIYIISVEGGPQSFGGDLRWDFRFQTNKDSYKKLLDECHKRGLVITSVDVEPPPSVYGHSIYGEYCSSKEDLLEYEAKLTAAGIPLLEGVIEGVEESKESPKKKETPTDTGRHFDMDFDDVDLT